MTADQGPDRIIRETCITLILLETLLQLKLIALKSLSSTATVWRNCLRDEQRCPRIVGSVRQGQTTRRSPMGCWAGPTHPALRQSVLIIGSRPGVTLGRAQHVTPTPPLRRRRKWHLHRSPFPDLCRGGGASGNGYKSEARSLPKVSPELRSRALPQEPQRPRRVEWLPGWCAPLAQPDTPSGDRPWLLTGYLETRA
jgi:hypothetical protein